MAANSPSTGKIVTTSLIVTGNMVGAGILAMPINLGPAGFLPATVGAFAVWGLMTYTALVIARQPFLAKNSNADLPTFFEAALGPVGKWVSVAANLVILYGLMTAYLAGVASVAASSFDTAIPEWALLGIYFIPATLLASFGNVVLSKCNALLMTTMWALFGILVLMVIPHFHAEKLLAADLRFFASGLPILVVAFNFHNVVPTLCRVLDHDRDAITRAIWLGSGIGMFMTVLWTVSVMATLPMEAADGVDILTAFKMNVPATVPLNKLIGSSLFIKSSIAFAIVAMTTSYMASGVALLSFLKDVAGDKIRSPFIFWVLAFIPPLLVGIIYPNIFLTALNIVGGLGVGTLFGVLPGLLLVRQSAPGSWMRRVGWCVIIFFCIVLCVEVGQELGVLHIQPDVEYWTMQQTK